MAQLPQASAARIALALAVAVGLLGAAGCGYPKAVPTYEFLTTYDRMDDSYEPLLSLVYVAQPTALNRYRGLIVGPVDVGEQWVESPAQARGYATYFRVVLRRELCDFGKFDFVSLDKDCEGKGASSARVLLLEGKITKFDMGSGTMRYFSYFIPFLQGGATDFQIEGRITEADTGRLVLEFVDRRRHLCNTPYGPNPSSFDGGFAMRVTAKETARCLAAFLKMGLEGMPPVALAQAEADAAKGQL